MKRIAAWLLLPLTLLAGLAVASDDEPEGVAPGAKAPDFRLNDHTGRGLSLGAHGKDAWTVIAFYPKSLTPG